MNDPASSARGLGRPEDARAFLERNADIEAVQLVITDANGVGRGKNIAREELDALYGRGSQRRGVDPRSRRHRRGRRGDRARLVGRRRGPVLPAGRRFARSRALAHATYRASARHDVRARRPAGACRSAPRAGAGREARRGARTDAGGRRGARVLPAAAGGRRRGCSRRAACGRACAARASTPMVSAGSTTCRRCSTTCMPAARALGLPVRTLMSEYAPGQFEITLEHRADALRAVDEAMLFKRAVRGVAARHGCIACFMAKPFAELAGSGMHLHASLADRARPQRVRRRRSGRHRRCCVTRSADCARRWRTAWRCSRRTPTRIVASARMSYAPVAATWGVNNRTVSLRVPAGPPASRHVEHRVAGARRQPVPRRGAGARGDAARHRARIDPGPPIAGQRLRAGAARRVADAMARGARACGALGVLADALGTDFLEVFLAIKTQECEKFGALVTDRDYEWYLDTRLTEVVDGRNRRRRAAAAANALSQIDCRFFESWVNVAAVRGARRIRAHPDSHPQRLDHRDPTFRPHDRPQRQPFDQESHRK